MRRLGNSDLHLSIVGFGAWAAGGGGWAFGWGPQKDADSIASIRHALEQGVNWIDTAAVYGLGHSEEVVRRALEGIPAASRPYIFTKCGLVWDESLPEAAPRQVLEPQSIRRECEASLRRGPNRPLPVPLARSNRNGGGGFLGDDDPTGG